MTAQTDSPEQDLSTPHRPFLGMMLRLLAMVAVTIMFASVKLAGERGVHLVETLFFRQFFALPIVLLGMWSGLVPGGVKTSRLGGHVSRSALGTLGMILNFLSFMLLPLTEATTISFTVPIFATILSALFLSERTGIHRWAAVIVGFIGVVIIANPGTHLEIPLLGLVVAIAAAMATSSTSIVLRQLGRTEEPGTTVFYFTVLSLPALAILMIFYAEPHDGMTYLLLAGMGAAGGIGQLLMTAALRYAPVSVVLPMDYSSLLWATLLSWFVWNSWPAPATWIGAPIIIASGLYIAWREHVNKRPLTVRPAVGE